MRHLYLFCAITVLAASTLACSEDTTTESDMQFSNGDMNTSESLDMSPPDSGLDLSTSPEDMPSSPADSGQSPEDLGTAGLIDDTRLGERVSYTIDSPDGPREFEVYLPPSYSTSQPSAMVLLFHGGNGNATGDTTKSIDLAESTGLIDKASQEGFVLISPKGIGGNWADGRGETQVELDGVDDVAFIEDMIARLQADLAIDARRIYATGFSNGAILLHLLACQMPGVLAAIGPVAGLIPDNVTTCQGALPTAVVQIQGALDPFQNLDGSPIMSPTGGSGEALDSAYATASFWVRANACTMAEEIEALETREDMEGSEVELYRARGCAQGADIDFYIVQDLGHRWPPTNPDDKPFFDRISGPNSDAIDATETLWDFFVAHPLPTR